MREICKSGSVGAVGSNPHGDPAESAIADASVNAVIHWIPAPGGSGWCSSR